MSQLRNELIHAFIAFKKGEISIKQAREINKFAKNIINTAKIQIAYQLINSSNVKIPYLEEPKELNQ